MAGAMLLWSAAVRTESGPSGQDVCAFRMVTVLCVLAAVATAAGLLYRRFMPRRHGLDLVVAGWWLYVTVRYWFFPSFPARNDYHEYTVLFLAYCALRLILPVCGKAFRNIWMAGLLALGAFQLFIGFRQFFGWAASHHSLYAVTGTFFNPGPYAILLAVVLAMALGVYGQGGKRTQAACLALWAAGLPMLAATWSRAAGVAVAFPAMVWAWRQGHRKAVAWALALLLCIGVAAYFLKQGSADGRVLMALVSLRAWGAEWWAGHGIGSFAHAYGEAQAAYFAAHSGSPFVEVAGSPGYAFNALSGVAVEQGLVGVMFALAATLWSLSALWRRGDAAAYGWMALLTASLFSYPFELWPFRLTGVAFVAMAATREEAEPVRRAGWASWLALPMCVLMAWASVPLSRHAARRVEAYADYVRLRGIQDTAFTDDFRRSYALLDDRADFLFTYGTALRELGRYNDSNAVLRQGTRVSGDPMFHVVMGNNYHDLGVTEKAEEAYRKASALLPSRMYPLYRLMKLYEATGQKGKAERTARRIAAFHAKVDSPAVRQMRREARELIP